MSFQNRLDQKKLRRFDRLKQKQDAAKLIPHLGVRVTKQMVKSHRYLRDHGLPFSKNVADVKIDRAVQHDEGNVFHSHLRKVVEPLGLAARIIALFHKLTGKEPVAD